MQIRDARPGEEKMIVEEFWQPLASEMEQYSDLNKLKADASEKSYEPMLERIQDEKYRVMILEKDGPKAYMMLEHEISSTRMRGRAVKIVDLYVKKGFRGEGLGTEMVEKAQEYARKNDFDYVKVASEWENQRAREFYDKLDFEPKKIQYVHKVN